MPPLMHVAAMTSISLLWSPAVHSVSCCVCTLQSLKCPLFSAKRSHHACHPDYWYFFT